jgi:ABC-type Fe3+-siderophore transport system, permease component
MANDLRLKRGEARRAGSPGVIFAALLVLLIAVACLTISYRVSGLAWGPLFHPSDSSEDTLLTYTVWHVRLPRLMLAISLGAALAVAGCLLQTITRNGLADPEIMGLNQGASWLAVVALLFFGEMDSSNVILLAALCGAGLSGTLLILFVRFGVRDQARFILAGVAISAFLGALTTGTLLLFETQLTEMLYWMAGKLSGAEWRDNKLIWMLDIPVLVAAYLSAGTLNVLAQGDEIASGLGVNVRRTRAYMAVIVMVLTGSAVAVAGPIGFVGLIVPHIARRIGGANHRLLLPLSALTGALLLASADFAAQWLSYPSEIPVGIVTALMGVPFFLYLLRRGRDVG